MDAVTEAVAAWDRDPVRWAGVRSPGAAGLCMGCTIAHGQGSAAHDCARHHNLPVGCDCVCEPRAEASPAKKQRLTYGR